MHVQAFLIRLLVLIQKCIKEYEPRTVHLFPIITNITTLFLQLGNCLPDFASNAGSFFKNYNYRKNNKRNANIDFQNLDSLILD